jgi:DNA-binding transcriptional ArsR family regulator
VLTIRFGPSDLASVRFTVSPLIELWQSVRALRGPVTPAVHPPWLMDARRRTRDLDFAQLQTFQPPMPDATIDDLDDLPRTYWDRVLAPHWNRIRTVLEGDVLHRANETASGGIRALFGDLDDSVCYEDDRLTIDKSWTESVELCGRGLLLVPSVFVWPAVAIIDTGPWQPTLIYPARGSGLLWEPMTPPREALAALIGARRASVLALLETPCSTTDLARRLDVGPASVSQHLTVLHDAGLIERHRVGRIVLYRRSAAGNLLVASNGHAGGREVGPASGRQVA